MADRVEPTQRGFDVPEDFFNNQEAQNHEQADCERGGVITRKRNRPFGMVSFDLIECKSLPVQARLVAIWIESKPDGWKVYPSVLQSALGISEKQWLSARRAMIDTGIFRHTKYRDEHGRWVWKSEFDVTPILNSIPPFTVHGEAADIKGRDKEVRNGSKQSTEAHFSVEQCARSVPARYSSRRCKPSLSDLKQLHIGHVLNALDLEWYEEGDYVYWETHHRARKAEDGHWLWIEVDGAGETSNSGSAIDLIQSSNGVTTREAISFLREIYQTAVNTKP